MNLENNYYYWKKALPVSLCKDIIKYALTIKKTRGTVGVSKSKFKLNVIKKSRDSNVVWLSDEWIYREIIPFIQEANVKANWNFQLTKAEPMQFTIYGKEQHYGWHCDSFVLDPNGKNDQIVFPDLSRKLSLTVSLNDESEYSGGYLEIDNRNNFHQKNIHRLEIIRTTGSLVVFPSFLYHRVTPVKKGTRYSLVVWMNGKPFK